MKEVDPYKLHNLGKRISNCDENKWQNEAAYDVILKANLAKFAQVKTAPDVLLSTENDVLCEATAHPIYGIGMKQTNPSAFDPATWPGKNFLGKVLEEVRAECHTA